MIERGTTQYTNIYDAIKSSRRELTSERVRGGDIQRVLILLTDGIANRPKNPQGRTEREDILFAERLALEEAVKAKEDGINIFTIGLGDNTNKDFLKNIASAEANHFIAPTTDDLGAIYELISSGICEKKPAVVDITYRIFGTSM